MNSNAGEVHIVNRKMVVIGPYSSRMITLHLLLFLICFAFGLACSISVCFLLVCEFCFGFDTSLHTSLLF